MHSWENAGGEHVQPLVPILLRSLLSDVDIHNGLKTNDIRVRFVAFLACGVETAHASKFNISNNVLRLGAMR
jgi:hypothetical protein